VALFHRKMKQQRSCLLARARAFHHRRAGCGPLPWLHGASAAPSPSPGHREGPQREDSPGPSAMEAVVQCRPRSTETPSCSLHMTSLWPLPKSHMWLRISPCRAVSERLGRSPCPLLGAGGLRAPRTRELLRVSLRRANNSLLLQVCVHILAISSRKLCVFLPDRVSRKEGIAEFSQQS